MDKFSHMFEAYKRHAEIIIKDHETEIPQGLNFDTMMKKSLSSSLNVDGRVLWKSVWESTNAYIKNTMLVKWKEVRPATKAGRILSGVQNFEPSLLRLRMILFDMEKNSIPVVIEGISTKSSDTKDHDDDDGEDDDGKHATPDKTTITETDVVNKETEKPMDDVKNEANKEGEKVENLERRLNSITTGSPSNGWRFVNLDLFRRIHMTYGLIYYQHCITKT